MAAVVAGARANEVCSVTLITPWNRLSELVQEKLPMFPARLLLKTEYASDLELQPYTGPVTIVAAERDGMIPPRHARRLADAHAGAKWELLPAVGHNTWPQRVDAAAWRKWLNDCPDISAN
jgi:pimeloyl-ACP methyl ester carboxylesterase